MVVMSEPAFKLVNMESEHTKVSALKPARALHDCQKHQVEAPSSNAATFRVRRGARA
jgi:hypothetical protein